MRASPSWTARYAAVVGGARSRAARRPSGATSTRRAESRDRRPWLRTPLPAITNGARACTTPSDPCSPRWPPWSSQLCDAEWITQRSGAAGRVEELGDLVVGVRVGVVAPVRVLVRQLLGERRELVGRLVGERVAALAWRSRSSVAVGRSAGTGPSRRGSGPRSRRRGGSAPCRRSGRARDRAGSRGRASAASRCSSAISCTWLTTAEATARSRPGIVAPCSPACDQGRGAATLVCPSGDASFAPGPRPRSASERPKEDAVRTFTPRPSDITRQWHVIDAEDAILGRLATEVAALLRGKHKPIWAPHVDTGDHVIVINAAKLDVSPRKGDGQALPPAHRLPGRHQHRDPRAPARPDPEKVVRLAVKRMLPKGPLGRAQLKKLKVLRRPHPPAPGAAARPAAAVRPRARARHRLRRTSLVSKPLIQTTGRRKEAVARVRLRPGTGVIVVNGRPFAAYFPILTHQVIAKEPLRLTQTEEVYDVDATLDGGGVSGQAGAHPPRHRPGAHRPRPRHARPCSRRPGSSPATRVRRSGASTASRRPARRRSTRSADARGARAAVRHRRRPGRRRH